VLHRARIRSQFPTQLDKDRRNCILEALRVSCMCSLGANAPMIEVWEEIREEVREEVWEEVWEEALRCLVYLL